MSSLLHQFILQQAEHRPTSLALGYRGQWLDYRQLAWQVTRAAAGLLTLGLARQQRVAVYLDKRPEAVVSYFATTLAGGVFVPVNPVLKSGQAAHILNDCQAQILVTNKARWQQLAQWPLAGLQQVILVDESANPDPRLHGWGELPAPEQDAPALPLVLETDVAAIFYTSGSTGMPKGVVLSHRNMVLGAESVAQYLDSRASDRLLAVQPLSFDYGFSQLTIAFSSGAGCYLMEYLFPRDILTTVAEQQITGLALVPPLWIKLANLDWPEGVGRSLRYFTNTGGCLPQATLAVLRDRLPGAAPFLMYGLTEAFRSCYLPPAEIDRRPGSFGKAIPNAEILVINQDGQPCGPHEPGELVHRGGLVSLGYWNDPQKTAERFKPLPDGLSALPRPELAVWSGDIVTRDEAGYLYFVGRNDEMIKTSGYRVSPAEIEDVCYRSGAIDEVVALGIAHPELGQAIVLVAVSRLAPAETEAALRRFCSRELANYMQPVAIVFQPELARNGNGKIDRKALEARYQDYFQQETAS